MVCVSGTSADIMKVGGYKLSALEIESAILEVRLLIHSLSVYGHGPFIAGHLFLFF